MKNKGFTLIELLGVIIILAFLLLLVFPSVINSIKKSSNEIDNQILSLIYNAADIYISKNNDNFPKTNGNEYIIGILDLVSEDLLPNDLKTSNNETINDRCVKVTYSDKYIYEIKSGNICVNNNIYVDLIEGLIPIKYNGSNWEVTDISDPEWYDYLNQKWANAAILAEGISNEPGTELTKLNEQVKAMFVYIPRYEYKITGDYGKGGKSATEPGEIEVNFISITQRKATKGYTIHPAFEFGSKKLNGIWVGKFELSHLEYYNTEGYYEEDLQKILVYSTEAKYEDYHSKDILTENSLICNAESCLTASKLRILPNKHALRRFSPASFFYSVRAMSTNGNSFGLESADTHVIKNSEWGAVAYLSQSKYGKYGNDDYNGANKEIYINNSYLRVTGMSAGNPGKNTVKYDNTTTSSGSSVEDFDIKMEESEETYEGDSFAYDTPQGFGASTTGNITGVYDMSGGTYEFVMALFNKVSRNDGGFGLKSGTSKIQCNTYIENTTSCVSSTSIKLPDSKYYDFLEYEVVSKKINEEFPYKDQYGNLSLLTTKLDKGQALSELSLDINIARIKEAIENQSSTTAAKKGGLTYTWYNDIHYYWDNSTYLTTAEKTNSIQNSYGSTNIGPWIQRGGSNISAFDILGRSQKDSGVFVAGESHLIDAPASKNISTRVVLVSN